VVSFLPLLKSLSIVSVLAALVVALAIAYPWIGATVSALKTPVPAAAFDSPLASKSSTETMVVAGGCFWGVQAVFQSVRGVLSATSGYAGGTKDTAEYEIVSTGRTGHAESVKVVYDPSRISYGQLLKVFFSVAHDPTQLNQQGPDVGRQYRSAIFYADDTQRAIARAYIEQLEAARVFRRRIVTEVAQLQRFYDAEAYHQGYFFSHPLEPYIIINDKPKVAALRQQFPDLYVERR
jgi:peptide-methionine (S)-S-oxide reductase